MFLHSHLGFVGLILTLLELTLICSGSPLLESVDKLFSQALTATVTAFAHQLSLALRGELNPGVEYGDSNANSSRQWLQMVGKKGVLAHFEGTMLPKEVWG